MRQCRHLACPGGKQHVLLVGKATIGLAATKDVHALSSAVIQVSLQLHLDALKCATAQALLFFHDSGFESWENSQLKAPLQETALLRSYCRSISAVEIPSQSKDTTPSAEIQARPVERCCGELLAQHWVRR